MKSYFLSLCITTWFCCVVHSQEKTPLPSDAADLLARYSRWMDDEQKVLESNFKEKRLAVVASLQGLKQDATKKGDLNGALAIEAEITRLKAQELRVSLLKLLEGEWEWSTGAKGKFGPAGKNSKGQQVIWVIDPENRLLLLRAEPDWHYDIHLGADGDSFTAKRIQSGKEYSAKRVSN